MHYSYVLIELFYMTNIQEGFAAKLDVKSYPLFDWILASGVPTCQAYILLVFFTAVKRASSGTSSYLISHLSWGR